MDIRAVQDCHSREGGNPENIENDWMPACAGMTGEPSIFMFLDRPATHKV